MSGIRYVFLVTLCTAAFQLGKGRQLSLRRPEGPLQLADGGASEDSAAPLKSQSYEEGQEDYAENDESNSSDYVRQYSYDPNMKDPKNTIFAKAGERMKRKSEPGKEETARIRDEEGTLAELKEAGGGGLSRVVAGCVPRSLQDLARNYKWMVAATKQFIKAANRTVMERVLEECGCATFVEISTCEPPIDIACFEHRSRRKEEPEEEEYEDYEEEGTSSKLISGRGGQPGRDFRQRRPGPRTRRFTRVDNKEATAEGKSSEGGQRSAAVSDHAAAQRRGGDEVVGGV